MSNWVWINGGVLTENGNNEYYVPSGSITTAGVQMTGGTWTGGNSSHTIRLDGNGSGVPNAYIETNPTTTTAFMSPYLVAYEGGTINFNIGAGTVTGGAWPGVDAEFAGSSLGTNFNGGTTNIIMSGPGIMEISAAQTLNDNLGTLTVSGGTLRLKGTGITGFAGGEVSANTAGAVLQLNAANSTDNLTLPTLATVDIEPGAMLSKIGPGIVQLSPSNWLSSSGSVTVQAGKLYVNSTALSGQPVYVNGGFLGGTGSVGNVAVSSGGGIEGGNAGAGALTLNSLTYTGTGNIQASLASGNSPVVVTNGVTGGPGSIAVTVLNAPANGTYALLTYGSGGDPFSDFKMSAVTRKFTLVDSAGSVQLAVNNNLYPIWTGKYSGDWSLASEPAPGNWVVNTGGTTNFLTGDNCWFDDSAGTAGGTTNITLNNGNVPAGAVTFANNAYAYTLSGTAGISAGSITKTGTGLVIINTANSYTGATNVNGGTLAINGSLGSGSAVEVGAGGAGTLAGSGSIGGPATISGNGAVNLAAGGVIANTLATSGGNWNGQGTVSGAISANPGTFTLGSGANLTANGGLLFNGGSISGPGTVNISAAPTITINASGGTIGAAIVSTTSQTNLYGTGALTIAGQREFRRAGHRTPDEYRQRQRRHAQRGQRSQCVRGRLLHANRRRDLRPQRLLQSDRRLGQYNRQFRPGRI